MLFVLEDNIRRIDEMRRVLAGIPEAVFAVSAHEAIRGIQSHWDAIRLVSLDHDLEKQSPGDADPGDGRDVSRWLATRPPKFPVLIHTSNSTMGDSMYFTLVDARFAVDRIDPYDDLAWIEKSWLPKIRRGLTSR